MNKVSRFLAPIKQSPFLYLRTMLVFLLWGLDGVIHVFFLQKLTHFLEISDKISFENTITYYIIYLVTYYILFFATGRYGRTETYNRTVINIQRNYLQGFIQLDNNKIEGIGTGKMVAVIKGGIDMWGKLLAMIIENFTQIFVIIVFTLYMLYKVNPIYAYVFIFLYIFFHLIAGYFNTKVIEIRKHRIEVKSSYTKHFVKILMSKFEILQSNKIDKEVDLLDEYQFKEIYYNKKMSMMMNFVFRVPEGGMDLILLFVFIFFGKQVFDGTMELSVFVGISGMLVLMKKAISKSVEVYKNFTKDFIEVDKLWELYDTTHKISGYDDGKDFKYKTGEIELKNITYSYTLDSKLVLEKFSLNIEGGKLTALVGPSGGGKSTIVKLISGYIKANSGKIKVDGQDLTKVSLKSYYKNIGYLTQEPSVFDGTVYENLTYAIDREVKQEEIQEIIKLSKCEFIHELKKGLHTQIGERGVKLSGGQKQRLAIAKIFLKNPYIIILDEPTSALDSFSEELITKAMNNLFKDRTVIVIAHRLQTVRHADIIHVLSDGKLIESGKHTELIKKGGEYKKMLDLQSGF